MLSVLSVLSVGTVGTYGYYKKIKTGGVTFFFCQTLMGQNECIEYLNISRLYLLTDPLACPVQKQVGPESWNLNLLRASWGRPWGRGCTKHEPVRGNVAMRSKPKTRRRTRW